MTSYILNRLHTQKWIVFSWGFHKPIAIKNGLQFNVNGFIFNGIIQVIYNEGTDLFNIKLIRNNEVVILYPDVQVSELIEVLDSLIEKVENYSERVIEEYSLQ